MNIISQLNPNILFAINVCVPEYNESANEYYLNGKMLVDDGHLAYTYKDEQEVLDSEAEAWKDIVKQ